VTKLLGRFGLINLATVQQKMADRRSLFCQSLHHYRQTRLGVIIKLFIMLYQLLFLLSDREEAQKRRPGS